MNKEVVSDIIKRYIARKEIVFDLQAMEMVYEREVRTIHGPIPAGYTPGKVRKYQRITLSDIEDKLFHDFGVMGFRDKVCVQYFYLKETAGFFGFWRRPARLVIEFNDKGKGYKVILDKVA